MNIIFKEHREKLQTGQFNWLTAPIKVLLLSGLYVAAEDDVFVADIPPTAILARSGVLTSKNADDGYARGIPPEFLLLLTDTPVTGVALYVDTGDDATSTLICYTDDGPALPLLPIGFNYTITYNAALGGFYRA